MSQRLYMDDNASAPLRESAHQAAVAAMALRNASAVHAEGRAARACVDRARDAVAAFASATAESVVFTATGSEANMTALDPALHTDKKPVTHLLVSAIEHPSVAACGRFAPDNVLRIPAIPDGCVDGDALDGMLSALPVGAVPLVSVMAANNETGVLQPISAIADIVHAHGGVLHCDAVQVAGRVPFAIATEGADLLSISAHKLGGTTGAGALVLRNPAIGLSPLVTGGGQERNRRAGTEAVAAIAAFGAAVEEAANEAALWERVALFRDVIEGHILRSRPDAIIAGGNAPRLPNTIQVIVPGLTAETAIIAFDLAGAAISSGSACSSGKVTASPVLRAMGFSEACRQSRKRSIRSNRLTSTSTNMALRPISRWTRRPRAERGHHPVHFRPRRASPNGCSNGGWMPIALAEDERAHMGARRLSEDRFSGHLLLRRAQRAPTARKASTKSIRNCCAPMRSSAFR
jgi:cysteine desulfurase